MDREQQLIERVRRRFPSKRDALRLGIGDDAAVLRPATRTDWVVTTDTFLEGVHFLRSVYPSRAVGHKAIARATSDIAAMGARARYFFLTMGLPEAFTGQWLDDFLDGMARAASQYGLTLAGGDTTKYKAVIASLTVLGEIAPGRVVLRSGARPGDLLCVSGRLGEAQLGLELVLGKLDKKWRWTSLLKKHFYPEPRLALGEWLANNRMATSMIDTSDGLSTDLDHICKASGVGARVWAHKIPAVHVPRDLQQRRLNPLKLAVHGGEDYELLFTVPRKLAARLPHKLAGIPITNIGEITSQKKILLVDANGKSRPLRPGGWDPFRKR